MTKPSEPLPLVPTEATRATAEIVTARALRRSLLPGFDIEEIASELAALAHHRRQPINRAISRIDRAETQHASQVVHRAQLVLHAALDLTNEASGEVAA
jgi:hypothetical protein